MPRLAERLKDMQVPLPLGVWSEDFWVIWVLVVCIFFFLQTRRIPGKTLQKLKDVMECPNTQSSDWQSQLDWQIANYDL